MSAVNLISNKHIQSRYKHGRKEKYGYNESAELFNAESDVKHTDAETDVN